MATTAMTERAAGELIEFGFDREKIDLIKQQVAKDATDLELRFFLARAHQAGLDPLARQIHFVKRDGKPTIQVGIDGYRLIAARTREYVGSDDAVFDRESGNRPGKATVTVWRMIDGERHPFSASARWEEYYPGGKQAFLWDKMPYLMLAKCAEALALRKAFPQELSDFYTDEEMMQADAPQAPPRALPPSVPPPPAVPKPSNVHQHAQIRALAERGYPLAKALSEYGYESIEELDAQQAKDLIIQARTDIRTPPSARTTAPAQPTPGLFVASAKQIELFWSVGEDGGWNKDAKRQVLAELYPERLDASGRVSVRSLSRTEFDALIGLFEDRMELAYDPQGKAYLKQAGPPADES